MADDASYSDFLTKANADPNEGSTQTSNPQSTSQAKSKHDPSSLPSSLQPIVSNSSHTYTSDTDSPWEATFFSCSGPRSPSLSDFRKCLSHDGHTHDEVEELSEGDFDPRGQYKDVIDAVRHAGKGGKGEVAVFRVEKGKTRVEYYVLTVAEDGRKLVGVVTKAVES